MTQKGEKQYKRKNPDKIKRAEELVMTWYLDRLDTRHAHFFAVNNRPAMAAAEVKNPGPRAWRPDPNPPDTKLTARGTETRSFRSGRNLGSSMDVDVPGTYHLDKRLVFAKKVMLHLVNVNLDLHPALEMHAAGYQWSDIGEELGCSERQARSLVDAGLTTIVSLQILRNDIPLTWFGDEVAGGGAE